jgi:subtilisin family serine protease
MRVPFISESEEADDKIAFLTDEEQVEIITRTDGIIVEEDLQCHRAKDPVLEPFNLLRFPSGTSLTILTLDQDTSNPIPFVTVYLFSDWQARSGYKATTDLNGRAVINISSSHRAFEIIAAYPKTNYWNKFVKDISAHSVVKIELRKLDVDNSTPWGIELTQTPNSTGNNVRVAVIDSGIWRDHPNLDPTNGRNFIDNEPDHEWWNDEDGHGTHVAGVIAARRMATHGFNGYAPNAEVFAYRVFGGPDGGGYFSTINKAIQRAIDDQCDIVCMSLGGPRSASMRAKLEAATLNGVLCIAAAGNSGNGVEYPAAFDETLAVSALGKFGAYPDDSLHTMQESSLTSKDDNLYAAKFTCHGQDVSLVAPGVAVPSTVPEAGFAAWDGTSMACPHIVGLTAALLSGDSAVQNMPRDDNRTEAIKQLILQAVKDIGLPIEYQGNGLPQIP